MLLDCRQTRSSEKNVLIEDIRKSSRPDKEQGTYSTNSVQLWARLPSWKITLHVGFQGEWYVGFQGE
jgi:hypothetical protein